MRNIQLSKNENQNQRPFPLIAGLVVGWAIGRSTAPNTRCLYCGKLGHSKKICLNFRLARMYSEERELTSLYEDSHTSSVFEAEDPYQIDTPTLNHNSSAPAMPMDIEGSLEHSRTLINFIGDHNLSDLSRTADSSQPLAQLSQSPCTEIPKHSVAPDLIIPDLKGDDMIPLRKTNINPFGKRKTLDQCPLCMRNFHSRKEAIRHAIIDHTSPDLKLKRINIRSNNKCNKCKTNWSCCLLNLQCFGNLCLGCLPDFAEGCVAKLPSQNFDCIIQFSCPLCHKFHLLDPELGMLIYEPSGLPGFVQ